MTVELCPANKKHTVHDIVHVLLQCSQLAVTAPKDLKPTFINAYSVRAYSVRT